MGIFVNNNLFDIKIYYKEIYHNDILVSVKVLDNFEQGSFTILCQAKGRDFETMSKILEESTILNSITGSPMLRISQFYKLVVRNFIKKILIKSEVDEEIDVTAENINSMHYDIVKNIAKKWMSITGG
jgi:hypothetical protein